MTWEHCHGGDVMVLNLHFVMVSQQFVMGLSLVATFHYAQITTFVGNLTKIVEICLKWLNYLSKIMENLSKMVDLINSLRLDSICELSLKLILCMRGYELSAQNFFVTLAAM